MTKRSDIDGGRLIYTKEIGWIDKGHAKKVKMHPL